MQKNKTQNTQTPNLTGNVGHQQQFFFSFISLNFSQPFLSYEEQCRSYIGSGANFDTFTYIFKSVQVTTIFRPQLQKHNHNEKFMPGQQDSD